MCLDSERIINYILWLESIPPRPIAQFVNLFIGRKLCCDLAKVISETLLFKVVEMFAKDFCS